MGGKELKQGCSFLGGRKRQRVWKRMDGDGSKVHQRHGDVTIREKFFFPRKLAVWCTVFCLRSDSPFSGLFAELCCGLSSLSPKTHTFFFSSSHSHTLTKHPFHSFCIYLSFKVTSFVILLYTRIS